MHKIYNSLYASSSLRTPYITYHKTVCFGPSSLNLIRSKPKLSPRKEMVCAYRNELVFMDCSEVVWKQTVQKRRYPYVNVYDVI